MKAKLEAYKKIIEALLNERRSLQKKLLVSHDGNLFEAEHLYNILKNDKKVEATEEIVPDETALSE